MLICQTRRILRFRASTVPGHFFWLYIYYINIGKGYKITQRSIWSEKALKWIGALVTYWKNQGWKVIKPRLKCYSSNIYRRPGRVNTKFYFYIYPALLLQIIYYCGKRTKRKRETRMCLFDKSIVIKCLQNKKGNNFVI